MIVIQLRSGAICFVNYSRSICFTVQCNEVTRIYYFVKAAFCDQAFARIFVQFQYNRNIRNGSLHVKFYKGATSQKL